MATSELIDPLAANLTAIGLQLESCATTLRDHPAVAQVTRAQRLADDLLVKARNTVHNLRAPMTPPVLRDRIEALVQDDRATGLGVDVQSSGTPRRLPTAAEDALFGVV